MKNPLGGLSEFWLTVITVLCAVGLGILLFLQVILP